MQYLKGIAIAGLTAAMLMVAGALFPHPPVFGADTVCTAVADEGATVDEKLDRLLRVTREIYISLNPPPTERG